MRTSRAFIFGLIAGAAVVAAFLLGTQNIAEPQARSTPNALCFKDTAGDQFSEKHVETKLIACQVVGMTKAEAIAFIESFDLVYRIAVEDGESFALTEDYTDSRINLEIVTGLVVGATAW